MQVQALKSIEAARLAGDARRLRGVCWTNNSECPEVNVEVASFTAVKATSAPAEPVFSAPRRCDC
jgi:hypothetical protein